MLGALQLEDEILPRAVPGPRRVAPTQEARNARWLLVLIPTTLLVLAITTRVIVTSDQVSRRAASYIAETLSQKTRAAVQLSGVTFGWDFAPCFQDFEIYRLTGGYKLKATTQEACVDRWASALGSGFHAIRIRLKKPSIVLEGSRDSKSEKAFADVKPSALSSTTADGHRSALREIQVVFDDLTLDWSRMPFPDRVSSGTFGPIDGMLALQVRGAESAAQFVVREPKTGSTINGRVTPTAIGWDLSAGIEGDLVSIFGNLIEAPGVDIRKMPVSGRVGAVYASRTRRALIDLDIEEYDVDVANRLVSANRLVGFTAREKGRLSLDLDRSVLEMKDAVVEVNSIPVTLSLRIFPGAQASSPSFDVRADLNTTPLIRLLRSVPDAREPEFAKSLSPNVLFALSFSMAGVTKDPTTWQPKLEHRLVGIGAGGTGSGLEFLGGTFRYFPLISEGRSSVGRLIGPDSSSWQPFSRIPYVQKRAIIVSEDSSFYFHHGIDVSEIQEAIRQGLTTGEKTRGGSTLTQQLVKNLFLTRDRTALRKLQELLLTFHVESALTKDKIFELYMNLIEWGPDTYGIREAAWHYFNKRPDALTPREMVFLAVIIPSPISSHAQYEAGYVNARTTAKIDGLLEKLNRLGQLPDAAYEEAKSAKIRFARRKENP
jgi:hypothetical protein